VRILTSCSYAARAAVATAIRARPARIYWAHARQALFPNRGQSLRDRAALADEESLSR
jgi:hypothetical protein